MRISDLMSNLREDLRETTDLDYALVVREMNVRGDITTLQFNLGRAITRPNTKDNLELKANDQVLVFSREVKVLEEDEDTDLEGGSRNGVEANLDKATDFLSRQPFNANKFDIQSGQEPDMEEWLAFYQEQSKSEEDEEDNFSRELLLKPVITKLQSQASVTNPVQLIEIDGAVHFPGTYPLTQNARLTDLIQAGGGLKEFAHISKAELSRIALSKKRHIEHLSVDLERAVKGDRKHNISLLSKDRLLVFAQEAWTEDYSIILEGEVTFPGVYSVNRGETLADVIERAGGMSDFAYPQGAIFTRVDLKEKEEQELGQLRDQLKQEIASLSLRPGLRISSSPTEALGVINELADLEALGRMVIDLESILTGDKSRDVLLEDGDRLFVPPIRKTVTVIGQVQSPSTHFFDQNIDVDQYIRLAGGTKRQADYERIYVVHANGSVSLPERGRWFSRDKQVVLKPADTIVVPLDTDYSDNLNTWATVTQIMSQLGIAWAAIKN
jgi:protein involved in polysaccharide export with SLBB domain